MSVVRAAVNCEGRVYEGHRHSEAIHNAAKAGEATPITAKIQGFVLDTGEFVNRIEARPIAIRCGQLLFSKAKVGKPLISEELW